MKKACMTFLSLILLFTVMPSRSSAQDPITLVIKEGITKVIKAVDLKIQRLQNKTIWLQNAQKVMENTMAQLKLQEISAWVEKQRSLYQDYYAELWRVKSLVASYHRMRELTERQVQLVREYKRAWTLVHRDPHFSPGELRYIEQVYSGILQESLKNLEGVGLVIQSFSTRMGDAARLEIINKAAESLEANYLDLKSFSEQNALLSLQRAQSAREVEVVRQLYNLQ